MMMFFSDRLGRFPDYVFSSQLEIRESNGFAKEVVVMRGF
jgi:hypothetical protein